MHFVKLVCIIKTQEKTSNGINNQKQVILLI